MAILWHTRTEFYTLACVIIHLYLKETKCLVKKILCFIVFPENIFQNTKRNRKSCAIITVIHIVDITHFIALKEACFNSQKIFITLFIKFICCSPHKGLRVACN